MRIYKYKPTTPGCHGSSVTDLVGIARSTPEKSLVCPLSKSDGRNSSDRITTRREGGGHKYVYHIIGFRCYDRDGVSVGAAHIEYGPNRIARITLPHCMDGEKRYIIVPNKLYQGDVVGTGPSADIKPGNNLQLCHIPTGTVVHTVELRFGGGAKIAHSTGTSVQPVVKEGKYAQLRMPSGETRSMETACRVIIGEADSAEQSNINWSRTGRMRWKGAYPTVRGIVMDPVDRPHGGDEDKTSGGRHPISPWGKPRGRTHRPSKSSNRLIARRRRTGKKCW